MPLVVIWCVIGIVYLTIAVMIGWTDLKTFKEVCQERNFFENVLKIHLFNTISPDARMIGKHI